MSKTNSNNNCAYLNVIVHEEKFENVKVDFKKLDFKKVENVKVDWSYMCRVIIDRLHPEFSLLDVVCATDGIHVGDLWYDTVIPCDDGDEDEVISDEVWVILFCKDNKNKTVDLIVRYGYEGWYPIIRGGGGIEVPYKEIKKIVYNVEEKLRNEEELEKWLKNKRSSPEE